MHSNVNVEVESSDTGEQNLPVNGRSSADAADVTSAPSDLAESIGEYRSMSTAAMVSFGLGLLSIVSLLELALGIIPLIGAILGIQAWRTIKRNPEELTGLIFARLGVGLSAFFLIGGWVMATVIYYTEVPDGFDRISYAQLQPEEGAQEGIPASAKELDGKSVFIKGFIYPGPRKEAIKTFVLCRDNGTCCFGGPKPKMSDMIQVTMISKWRVNYSPRMFKLAGTFHIHPQQGEGDVGTVLYTLDAEYVK